MKKFLPEHSLLGCDSIQSGRNLKQPAFSIFVLEEIPWILMWVIPIVFKMN